MRMLLTRRLEVGAPDSARQRASTIVKQPRLKSGYLRISLFTATASEDDVHHYCGNIVLAESSHCGVRGVRGRNGRYCIQPCMRSIRATESAGCSVVIKPP